MARGGQPAPRGILSRVRGLAKCHHGGKIMPVVDQCVSSTVRSLADESYNVVVVEDCCAAGTDELHYQELEIINLIYCQVLSSDEVRRAMGLPDRF